MPEPKTRPNPKGEDLYKKNIIGAVYAENIGKYAAFDLNTGEFLIDRDKENASRRLEYKYPDADIWIARIRGSIVDRVKQMIVKKMHGG